MIKHADDAFINVVDVDKVTAAFAVVEDLYRLARQYNCDELEKHHVWPTQRAIDGKKHKPVVDKL